MYLLAVLLPPVAVLACGKPGLAFLNLMLTLCGFIPGMVHACMVVSEHKANERHGQLVRAVRGNRSRSPARPAEADEPADPNNPFAF